MATKKPAPAKTPTPQPTPKRQKPAAKAKPVQGWVDEPKDIPVAPPPAARPSNGTVATRSTAGAVVALSDRLKGYSARQREEIAKAPASTGNMLSFRGGTITLNEQPLGNSLPVIVLAAQFERAYYPGQFAAGEAVVPSCYSRDNKTPDDEAAFPQSEECHDCQWNQFESAREGTGKACKEGMKLAMVAAETAGDEGTPAIAQGRFSVLNTKLIRQDLAAIQAHPNIDHTVQAVCTLKVVPDQRSQYRANLLFEGYTPADVVEKLANMIEPALEMLNEKYPDTLAVDPKEVAAKGKPSRTVRSY